MRRIAFTKMVASGNDFVAIAADSYQLPAISLSHFARRICDRKYGVGADGLLVLDKPVNSSAKMRIFNADGSEAEMCGNGARCAALWISKKINKTGICPSLKTKAGIIQTEVNKGSVRIKLTDPKNIKLNIPIRIGNRVIRVNSINTGVPHLVIFTEGLDKINIVPIGRLLRYHKKFLPAGTNVNFVEVLGNNHISVRTYERGVEDETLACGTGSTASALIFALKTNCGNKIKALTRSKEILNIYFKQTPAKIDDVWLEGSAKIVHKGEFYV